MNSNTFEEALGLLEKGQVPPNVNEVRGFAYENYSHIMRGFYALFECVVKLNASNKVLREMSDRLKKQNAELRDRVENLEIRLEAATDR